MKEYTMKILRITAGILLLILGAIGGLIPIFQGWVFGLMGLMILSKDVTFVRKYHDKVKAWYEQKKRERRQKKEHPPDKNNLP